MRRRDVAHHVEANRFIEKLAHALDEVVLVPCVVRLELEVPVALDDGCAARRRDQKMPGFQLVDAVDDGFGGRSGEEREQVRDRAPVQLALDLRQLQNRLQLGSEEKPAADLGVVERLDSDPVAREQQLPASLVPKSKANMPRR